MLDALELDSSANIVDSMVKAGNEATANLDFREKSRPNYAALGLTLPGLEDADPIDGGRYHGQRGLELIRSQIANDPDVVGLGLITLA
jgi:hypothetical protein